MSQNTILWCQKLYMPTTYAYVWILMAFKTKLRLTINIVNGGRLKMTFYVAFIVSMHNLESAQVLVVGQFV